MSAFYFFILISLEGENGEIISCIYETFSNNTLMAVQE